MKGVSAVEKSEGKKGNKKKEEIRGGLRQEQRKNLRMEGSFGRQRGNTIEAAAVEQKKTKEKTAAKEANRRRKEKPREFRSREN